MDEGLQSPYERKDVVVSPKLPPKEQENAAIEKVVISLVVSLN